MPSLEGNVELNENIRGIRIVAGCDDWLLISA